MWNIGNVQIPNRVVLAPMAGVTDLVARRIAKEMGAGLTITEMVNDMGLVYAQHQTLALADIDEPGIRAIQLFGSRPDTIRQAVQKLRDYAPDIVDINMGCPMRKIVNNGAGSALMLDPARAAAIVETVRSELDVPVTVKIRSGWDEQSVNAPRFARSMEQAGACAITIHARTREQFYSGQADWNIIAEVKQSVSIPVVGNGDIWQPEHAAQMIEQTGCDAVMIGRGAMGNPWLLHRTIRYLEDQTELPEPTVVEKIHMAVRHLCELAAYKGEYTAVREMRKQSSWYIKGAYGAAQMRTLLIQQTELEPMRALLLHYAETLQTEGHLN